MVKTYFSTDLDLKRDLKLWMNNEEKRLVTFLHPWLDKFDFPTIKGISVYSIVCNGFYFTGINDRIRCNFCNVILFNFNPYDDIAIEHQIYSPNCPLIQNPFHCGNQPMFSGQTLLRDLKRAQSIEYRTACQHRSQDYINLIKSFESLRPFYSTNIQQQMTGNNYLVMKKQSQSLSEMTKFAKRIACSDVQLKFLSCENDDLLVKHYQTDSSTSAKIEENSIIVCPGKDFKRRMKNEQSRLASFRMPWTTDDFSFPIFEEIHVYSLATHGFYYVGYRTMDQIRCNFCGLNLSEFEHFDDIAYLHLQNSPHCPMVKDNKCENKVVFSKNVRFGDLQRAKNELFRATRKKMTEKQIQMYNIKYPLGRFTRRTNKNKRIKNALNEMNIAQEEIFQHDGLGKKNFGIFKTDDVSDPFYPNE